MDPGFCAVCCGLRVPANGPRNHARGDLHRDGERASTRALTHSGSHGIDPRRGTQTERR